MNDNRVLTRKSVGGRLCYDGRMQNACDNVSPDSPDNLSDTSAQSGVSAVSSSDARGTRQPVVPAGHQPAVTRQLDASVVSQTPANQPSASSPRTPSASRGVFISFEGGEGVGKSTQILLLAARLEAAGIEVLRLREPGGTRIGELIRQILLDPANTELDDVSELLLYEAARAQLVSQVIEPALARGVTVLCDRFIDSTLAYQGQARGLGFEIVGRANRLGSKGLVPDRTIVLIHDLHQALSRATEEGADRLEAEGLPFHARVLEGYQHVAEREATRVRLVQSREHKGDTAVAVFAELADLFPRAQALDFVITDDLIDRVREEHD